MFEKNLSKKTFLPFCQSSSIWNVDLFPTAAALVAVVALDPKKHGGQKRRATDLASTLQQQQKPHQQQ